MAGSAAHKLRTAELVKAYNKGELEAAFELLGQWALGAALEQHHPQVMNCARSSRGGTELGPIAHSNTELAEQLQASSPLSAEELHGLMPGPLNEDKEKYCFGGSSYCRCAARSICWDSEIFVVQLTNER